MITAQQLVDQFGGIARGRQLAEFGFTRRRLATAVNQGEIQRIRPGVFATASAPRAARIAAGHGGALTCARALRHHGVWVLHEDEVSHVWMGPTGRVHHQRCACVAHFRPGRMQLGIAEVEDALVHAFHCYGEEFFFCAFQSAWNKRLIRADARARIRAALPQTARWLVDFARGDSQSGLESLVRLRLHLIGIEVQTQVELPGVGRVDFVIAGRIILEADGKENHEGRMRHKDLMRDAAASALGYESLHFDYDMIINDWDIVVAAVLAALARV
jgi:very-short-patch-repair endonuclease